MRRPLGIEDVNGATQRTHVQVMMVATAHRSV